MRPAPVPLLVLGLLLFSIRPATAQATALTVSGSPAAMNITIAVAGSPLPTITNASTTYFVKVKASAGVKKITAAIDAPMPLGTTLSLNLGASSGATSLGPVSLSTTPQDIVVNISKDAGSTLSITYTFSATVSAGVIPSQSRIVTLTLANYP